MTVKERLRIEYIDALKGFAIFCVVWGHSLQYLKKGHDFYHNPIFEFIYSYHMPLFFMVSGFFFRSSLKLQLSDFLSKKTLQLLVPCIVWAIIFSALRIVLGALKGTWPGIDYLLIELKDIINPNSWFWFLKELFVSYVICYASLRLFKNNFWACTVSILAVLIVPYFTAQRFLLPVFWFGIFLKDHYKSYVQHRTTILIATGLIFLVCLFFWDGKYTMYEAPVPLIFNFKSLQFDFTNIEISIFRLFIGLCGSLFWFAMFDKIYSQHWGYKLISKVGANTLAIYVLQKLILEDWIALRLNFPKLNMWFYNLVLTPLISIAVIAFCMFLIHWVQKNKYGALLLFGKA